MTEADERVVPPVTDGIVSLNHVSRVYGRAQVRALNDVSLSVSKGDYTAITGPSGSGKSTLLYMLCGLDRPTGGKVIFEGTEPSTPSQWAKIRASRIGFVFQSFNLLPMLTARENVEIPMFGVESDPAKRMARSCELLERMGLADRQCHLPGEMSGGESQRVAIARALANSPDIILADEPTGNLDSRTSANILELLEEIHTKGNMTLVIVTHNPAMADRAEKVIRLLDGGIE